MYFASVDLLSLLTADVKHCQRQRDYVPDSMFTRRAMESYAENHTKRQEDEPLDKRPNRCERCAVVSIENKTDLERTFGS